MAPIDFSMAAPIHQHLLQKGVSLYLEEGVTHFKRTDNGVTVFLKSGKTIPADMVLLSIGWRLPKKTSMPWAMPSNTPIR